jgi:cellulose synthase/poly-beta-1,6-N-acetylglucosamine synthase-like glycosyltransferase
MDILYQAWHYLLSVFHAPSPLLMFYALFPWVLIVEMPFYSINIIYTIRGWLRKYFTEDLPHYTPLASIVITAYNETFEELLVTFRSIDEQLYDGTIETFIVIDNAKDNQQTVAYTQKLIKQYQKEKRRYRMIAKQSRGGLAHSRNLAMPFVKGEFVVIVDADTSLDNQTICNAAKHFFDPGVIAVSGALRVRNFKDSLCAKFQALEYIISINLGRFGLTELGVTNNISGAFGIFRTSLIKRIGGWLNGTAEDLDLTLRLHRYLSFYKHLKIVHEPHAIAWTVAPDNFRDLLKQRLRWDGDLFFIYVRRHWKFFNPKIYSLKKILFFSWYGLYFQLVLPFIIVIYTIMLPIVFSLGIALGALTLAALYYICLISFMFSLFLLMLSERPKMDLCFIPILPLYPIYTFFMRISAAYSTLYEMITKGHLDTSMAPWWVIRKTK